MGERVPRAQRPVFSAAIAMRAPRVVRVQGADVSNMPSDGASHSTGDIEPGSQFSRGDAPALVRYSGRAIGEIRGKARWL